MDMNIGDKFVVTNKIVGFLKEGDVVEVTSIRESGLISFVFTGENYKCEGSMSPSEFEKYFEKVDAEPEFETPTITVEMVEEIMANSEIEVQTVFGKCTVVSCKLPNGFVIVESFNCVSPDDYSEEQGVNICLDKIADKIFELESYLLQEELYQTEMSECPCDCCDCSECPCEEEDECLDTDLDCDDCDDYNCRFNPNNIKH